MGSKPKLGFLGLGLMGSQMTKRLIKNGYQVTGFDPDPDKMIGAVANGVIAAASPAEVARASDIVQACVINMPALTEAMFGPDGIIEGADADKIFLDHSTTIADKTRELAARLKNGYALGRCTGLGRTACCRNGRVGNHGRRQR